MKIDTTTEAVEYHHPPVAEKTRAELENFSDALADDYEQFKESFIEWLLTEGKDTYRGDGFAESTTRHTHYKVDEAYRWKWNQTKEYTTTFTPEDATTIIEFMMKKTKHPDRYIYSFEKCIRRLFKYLREELNRDLDEWEHDIPVDPKRGSEDHIKDRFYPAEMNYLYELALKRHSVKSYTNKNMSSAERDKLTATISQRLGVPKAEVGAEEFKQSSSWKFPSIIAVCSDLGLRPIEVQRAKESWFEMNRQKMVVPKEDATKNEAYWECDLSDKAANAVRKWIAERGSYELYQSRDEMWLTRQGNPYKARSLNKFLSKLMEASEIEQNNRKLSWYSFRHGAATMWVQEEGLAKAKRQLRHKSIETTLKYTRDDGNNHQRNSHW